MYDMASLYQHDTHNDLSKSQRNKIWGFEQCGPCPFPGCGATDAFHVYPEANYVPDVGYLGRFDCMDSSQGRSGCGKSGDMIDYLEMRHGMGFREACEKIEIDHKALLLYRNNGSPRVATNVPEHEETKPFSEINEKWRSTALDLARYASGQFTDEALEYLHGRGIQDATIKRHLLGFYPTYKWANRELWGFSPGHRMPIPRGIVIPYFNDNHEVICLRFRRLPSDESDQARQFYGVDKKTGKIGRYQVILGSSSNFLYNGDCLLSGSDVAVFEGEFDALLVAQETNRCVCVATGSTAWGRSSKQNIRKLQACDTVLLCFDQDKSGHGATTQWEKLVSHARPWLPLWGDVSEMYADGAILDDWIADGLGVEVASTVTQDEPVVQPVEESSAESAEEETELAEDERCVECGQMVERYLPDGTPCCAAHWEKMLVLSRAKQFAQIFPGECKIEVIKSSEIKAAKARILQEYREESRRREEAEMARIRERALSPRLRKMNKKVNV